MPVNLRADFFRNIIDTGIRNDQGIRLQLSQFFKIFPHSGQVAVMGKYVGCHMD